MTIKWRSAPWIRNGEWRYGIKRCPSLHLARSNYPQKVDCRTRSEPGGTRWRTGEEVKGKLGSQYSHATSERGVSSITKADAHTSAAGSRLNWRPHRFEWTRPFRGKTKSGFCACAITFRTNYTACSSLVYTTLHQQLKKFSTLTLIISCLTLRIPCYLFKESQTFSIFLWNASEDSWRQGAHGVALLLQNTSFKFTEG